MELNDYQALAVATLGPDRHPTLLALGICGEAGEVADELHAGVSPVPSRIAELVKKAHRPGREINKELLSKEIGDELWYLACLADTYGMKLSDIGIENINKLEERYGKPV